MVERFELDFHGLYGEDAYMAKAENGEFVRYSDYADLEAKLAAVHDRAKQAAAMCEAGYGVSAYNVATSILSAIEPAATCNESLQVVPAAPESQQEPVAYRIHAPEDEHYGTGPDRLQFHPLAQYDLDNGYRQTPLYAHPPAQAVTEAMVEAAQEAYRRVGKQHHWHPSWPDDDAMREILSAALKAAMEAGR